MHPDFQPDRAHLWDELRCRMALWMSLGECRWQQLQTQQGEESRGAAIAGLLPDQQPVPGQVRAQQAAQEIRRMRAAQDCTRQWYWARARLAQAVQPTIVSRIAGGQLKASSMQHQ